MRYIKWPTSLLNTIWCMVDDSYRQKYFCKSALTSVRPSLFLYILPVDMYYFKAKCTISFVVPLAWEASTSLHDANISAWWQYGSGHKIVNIGSFSNVLTLVPYSSSVPGHWALRLPSRFIIGYALRYWGFHFSARLLHSFTFASTVFFIPGFSILCTFYEFSLLIFQRSSTSEIKETKSVERLQKHLTKGNKILVTFYKKSYIRTVLQISLASMVVVL